MDPFSALSIATSILQFLDFTAKLLSSSKEIYRSVHGASSSNLALESSCTAMKAFSEKLGSSTGAPGSTGELGEKMKNLANDCKSDCDALVAKLQKLKVESHKNRRWESLKAALKTVWGTSEIRELEGRIDKARRLVAIYVQSLTMDNITQLGSQLRDLKAEGSRLQVNQTASFDRLTEDLSNLKLSVNASANQYQIQQSSDTQMMQSIDDIVRKLQEIQDNLEMKKRQNSILSSLSFPSRTARHEAIAEAAATTFQWIVDPTQSTLAEWLRRDCDSVFWVLGRAGSGKSTLMKFLAGHSSTLDFLKEWAHPKPVAIASHYFWSAGSSEQQSQRGLLQTLIYDVFCACPEIIPVICPLRWETVRLTHAQSWSMAELTSALQSISEHSRLETRFCWFIDGLDEYGGEHDSLCDFLVRLTKSANLKLCVSSRPLNVFRDAFEGRPQLATHDYTHNDIASFARERLQSHRRWADCSADELEKENLITEIRNKANGVFLWVFLVTRSLRDGLTNDDDLEELRKRLEAMPSELELLFKQMLDSIDSVYHEKMAETFLFVLEAGETPNLRWPLMLDALVYHENEESNPRYAIGWPVGSPSVADLDALRSRTRRRLNARSHGLLETVDSGGDDVETVEFLHRTVRDFLRTGEMVRYLRSKVKASFEPALSIVKAYTVVVKSRRFLGQGGDELWTYFRDAPGDAGGYLHYHLLDCFEFGSRVADRSLEVLGELLDELENSVVTMFESGQASCEGETLRCHPTLPFREALLQSHLYPRIAAYLPHEYFSNFEASPLFVLIHASIWEDWYDRGSSPVEAIEYLVSQLHFDPNELSKRIPHGTPWLYFICESCSIQGDDGLADFQLRIQMIPRFLALGADPNALNDVGSSAFSMFLTSKFVPLDFYEDYSEVLNDFIDAGASLSIETWVDDEIKTVAQTYCGKLRCAYERGSSGGGIDRWRRAEKDVALRTVRTLIERGLVSRTISPDFEWTIKYCFAHSEAQELLQLLEKSNSEQPAKRKAEGVYECEESKKMRVSGAQISSYPPGG